MRAMVLCAGYGTRLGELTREMPKPMLQLQGRPILAYILAHLHSQGFDEVAVNLHFMPEVIRGHFGNGSAFKIALTYVQEDKLLGTAGGIKNMEAFLREGDPFLVQYGDVVTDQDFGAIVRFHKSRGAMVTLLLHERARSNSVVSLDPEGRVTGLLERPTDDARRGVESHWVNSGICLCSPEIFRHIPAQAPCDLPRDVFPKLIGTGRIFGFPLTGYRCAIDSAQRLAEANAAVADGHCGISMVF